MSKYITNVAVLIKGDRVAKGVEVELDPEVAANMGSDLSPVGAVVEEETPEEPEKDIADMTVAELKAKAESMGLATSGTKADLIERISLGEEGGAEELSEDNEE